MKLWERFEQDFNFNVMGARNGACSIFVAPTPNTMRSRGAETQCASKVSMRCCWMRRACAKCNLEVEVDQLHAGTEQVLTSADRERLMALGRDLTIAWDSPGATPETRKKIIRTVISEIIVDVVGEHAGVGHSLARRRSHRSDGEEEPPWPDGLCTDDDIVDLVRALARHMPDQTIAAVLNRLGKSTSHGHSWTRGMNQDMRHSPRLSAPPPGRRRALTRTNAEARQPPRRGRRS